nr:MAG: RNA-dependent RNA polymerase [brine shrimp arlivirus 9]
MEDWFEESPPIIPRFTLDNPILPHNRKFLADILTGRSTGAPFFIQNEAADIRDKLARRNLTQISTNSERLYGHLFSPTLFEPYTLDRYAPEIDHVQRIIWNFLRSIKETDKFPSWSKIAGAEAQKVISVAKNKTFSDMVYWNTQIVKVRNTMAKLAATRDTQANSVVVCHPYAKFEVICTATFALWVCGNSSQDPTNLVENKVYLMDYDQICGIADTSEGRLLTIEASLLHEALNVFFMPKVSIISQVYKWGDKQLIAIGNNGYKVLKTFESILRTIILRNEPYDYCRSFHRRCLGDLQDILGEVNLPMENYTELYEILRLVDDLESAELSGVYRHWMHPTVDEEAGMRKVKRISDSKKTLDYKTVDKVLAAFNRSFVLEYIAQHRRWPKVKAIAPLKGPLLNWINRKSLLIDESAPGYHWTDWKNLAFGKEFEFDYKLDLLELLDDKACCLPKDECHTIFYKKHTSSDKCTTQSSRRVLLELLKRENFDTKQIIEKICKREIPDSWKAVGLHPKEREMKMEPRLFAILPIEVRAYFVLTEANIAKYLFKYFPQQTMNLNADQLDRRLLQMSQPDNTAGDERKRFTANLDFKSWNIYWTKEAVSSIFIQIGCLFGMPNLITFTHEFFEMAMLFLSSFANPPEKWTGKGFKHNQQCDCHLWFGHHGGLEGLRQKGWTLITVAMLEVVKLDTGIDSLITGQGDNQVIIFFIKILQGVMCSAQQLEEYFTNAIKNYIDHILKVAEGMGQHLKVDETWVSSRVVEYGKDMLVDGVFIPSVLKKVSRAFEVTNEISPGLQSQITHIFSVLQAACAKGLSWLPLYIQALYASHRTIIMYLYFDQSNPTRPPLEYTSPLLRDIVEYMLMTPRSIGGIAALPFTEFILRGHPDPVTSALVHVSILEKYFPLLPKHMTLLINGQFFSDKVDFLMLATAPDSLNLKNAQTEQNIWKSLVRNSISQTTKNPLFLEITKVASKEEEESFIQWMSTITPVFPRFLSVIYSASIFGAMSRVIGSFGNNRTLVFSSGATQVNRSLRKIRLAHSQQWETSKYITRSYRNQRPTEIASICLTRLAQHLRNKSWRLEDTPMGLYGSTVPHPFEQFAVKVNTVGKCPYIENCYNEAYIFFQIHQTEVNKPRCMSRGAADPYLSGRIRAKREQGIVHTTTLDSPIIAAANLASNRSSVTLEGSALDQSIINLVKSRTDIDINVVEALIGKVYGGTLWHRLPDNFTSHVVSLNCRPNITTHVYPSTDTMQQYSRGTTDYTLPYQSIFVLVNSLLSDASARGVLPADQLVLHAHLACELCTQEIYTLQLDCPDAYVPAELLTENPLIKSSTKTLPISERDLIRPPQRFIDNKEQNENHRRAAMSHMIIHRYINSIQVIVRGLTIYRRYHTDLQLRLADVISIGAIPLIQSIANQLLLLSPLLINWDTIKSIKDISHHLAVLINTSGSFIWQNVGQFATLPEFVSSIFQYYPDEDPGMDYGKGGSHTFRFLNRLLIKRLYATCKKNQPYKALKSLRLFLSDPNWTQNLYWAQHYIINTWMLTHFDSPMSPCQEILKMSLAPTETAVADKVQVCLRDPNTSIIVRVLQDYSPRVREYTPESDARYTGKFDIPSPELPSPVIAQNLPSQLPSICKLNIVNCMTTVVSIPTIIPPTHLERVDPKTRRDHEFKTVGHASTAMYKWTCVLSHLKLAERKCMTLGEGAGGLARGILEVFHADRVIFNSLIDSTGFDPHRLTSFIPSELRPWVHRIEELEYCREHGGDLLRDETVQRYKAWDNIKLVTCDAEVSSENIMHRMKLVRNVVEIATKALAKDGHLVLKSYILNLAGLIEEVELVMRFFSNVRVFYTIESSFENYEVFIEAWGVTEIEREAKLNQSTIIDLRNLALSRIHDQPLQAIYPQLHNQVHSILNSCRGTNLDYSLRIFSNELVGIENWNVKAVQDLQVVIILFAEERLRTHKNLIQARKTHGSSASLVGAVVSERTFLNNLSIWYINLEILRLLLISPSEDVWNTRLNDFQPTSIYFNISPTDLDDYEQRYARHFFHLLNFAKQRST